MYTYTRACTKACIHTQRHTHNIVEASAHHIVMFATNTFSNTHRSSLYLSNSRPHPCPYDVQIQGIEVDTLFISHIQVQHAPAMRRRTYRAHGRINPYMSCPAHVELILSAKTEPVKKAENEDGSSQKRIRGKRQQRLNNASSGFE